VPDIDVEERIVTNGQTDPLYGCVTTPDILLLRVAPESQLELEALAGYSPDERPPLIVIGDANDAKSMRAAMQAGARDYVSEPIVRDDLLAAVRQMTLESSSQRNKTSRKITAFINAKGGSGASFLAANVAHLLVAVSNRRTALVDLDLQVGNLPQYLDLKPTRGLLEALDAADDLDGVAIEAYLTKHKNGLAILAAWKIGIDLHQELMLGEFESVIGLLSENYERIVVDVPRQIEQFGALVVENADKVVLVMQQSVPSLQDTVRMCEILSRDFAVSYDRLIVVVNRCSKHASVQLTDIEKSLPGGHVITVPNDFGAVDESVNIGAPIYDQARRSPVTKALLRLEELIDGRPAATSRGLIARLRGTAS
jgi:pilus assembly protein CpaE